MQVSESASGLLICIRAQKKLGADRIWAKTEFIAQIAVLIIVDSVGLKTIGGQIITLTVCNRKGMKITHYPLTLLLV